jgi:hypothetical protein
VPSEGDVALILRILGGRPVSASVMPPYPYSIFLLAGQDPLHSGNVAPPRAGSCGTPHSSSQSPRRGSPAARATRPGPGAPECSADPGCLPAAGRTPRQPGCVYACCVTFPAFHRKYVLAPSACCLSSKCFVTTWSAVAAIPAVPTAVPTAVPSAAPAGPPALPANAPIIEVTPAVAAPAVTVAISLRVNARLLDAIFCSKSIS